MPLRYLIPALLVGLALFAGVVSYQTGSTAVHVQVVNTETEALRRLMNRLQEHIEYLYRRSDVARVEEEMAALSVEPHLTLALLLDQNARVLGSMRRAQAGVPGAPLLDRLLHPQWLRPTLDYMDRPDQLTSGEVRAVQDGSRLLGLYPIVLGSEEGGLRPDRMGLLVVQADLTHRHQAAQRVVEQQALAFAALLLGLAILAWGIVHLLVTRRMNRLLSVTRSLGRGDLEVRTGLSGHDELARLGEALDRMAGEIQQARDRLTRSEQRLRRAQAMGRMGDWQWDPATGEINWSAQVYRIFGQKPGSFKPTFERYCEAVHPDDRAMVLAHIDKARTQGIPYTFDHRIILPDGLERHVHSQGEAQRDSEGEIVSLRGTVQEVTDRKQAEAALFEAKERAQVTLHSIGDAVITTDHEAVITYLNPVAEELTGWSTDEATGQPLNKVFRIFNEFTLQPAPSPVETCLSEGRTVGLTNHTVLISRDGASRAIEDSAAPIRDREGNVLGVVLVFHDVSKTRQMARQLSWQATHDALTGLYNRYEFEMRLKDILAQTRNRPNQHALLYMDLDQFKVVNDTCGHGAGDELLKQLAYMLMGKVRESDTLARLGGDEFGVLLENCPLEKAQEIAHDLRQTVREFRFSWQESTFQVGISIGLVMIENGSLDVSEILSAADMACYAAKDLGRDRIHVYHPEDAELAQRRGEMRAISHITDALGHDRFRLYCQEIRHTGHDPDVRPVGEHMEILVRMANEDGDLIPPGAFIPAAERFDLMPAIDRWVIHTFFREHGDRIREQCTDHAGTVRPACLYAINLSGASVSSDIFLSFVIEQLEKYHIPPEAICFEITETAAIANLTRALHFMNELRGRGCLFSLDDFGTGVSSFGYLKNLPVDYLKIDGSLVKDIVTDPIDHAMVDAINRIGHVMGIRTVAEFVENDEILECLKALGVDYAQGYGIARPKPLDPQGVALREG
ncbi:sensor domain-containing diguanylate cyclase [Thioalkalivibrio denitrificans]|uniref:Sensor domain-containing diguanylate cyclase n=1 Tax=Thioalkalivibrio denitrificans TaxID=108003 RepID=A0A1V3N9I0_9GAMM|nr:EAL domain-containing protein [Thioalkalivibrio denitrificans]OOG21472.1 sensor domain-containing diguanylate cyclase [Thioalkalivibrio denitrificans]